MCNQPGRSGCRKRERPHERVITVIAEGCEGGRIAAAYRTITGVHELDLGVWRSPSWRRYFERGEIDLDLPLLDENWRPHKSGFTARCPCEIFVRRDSLDRLIASIEPASKPPVPRRRGGRPPHDWEAIRKVVFQLMDYHDEFSIDDPKWNAQARLEEAILDRFEVGVSTLRKRLPEMLAAWRKTKVRN